MLDVVSEHFVALQPRASPDESESATDSSESAPDSSEADDMEALALASSLAVFWTAARALRRVPLMHGAQGLYQLVLPALELE